MKTIRNKRWANGYQFYPFRVRTTNLRFAYSRDPYDGSTRDSSSIKGTFEDRSRSSNSTSIGNPFLAESIINGVLQGRKRDDPKGATKISRASMMNLALQIRDAFLGPTVSVPDQEPTAPSQPDDMIVTKPKSLEALAAAVDVVTSIEGPADPVSVDDGAQQRNGDAMNKLFMGAKTYYEAKRDLALIARRKVKMDVTTVALQNWIQNEVDDFPIEVSRQ